MKKEVRLRLSCRVEQPVLTITSVIYQRLTTVIEYQTLCFKCRDSESSLTLIQLDSNTRQRKDVGVYTYIVSLYSHSAVA